MKNIKYISIALVILSVFIVSSCKKSFYTDANGDPNTPPSVTPSSLLSSAEGSIAYTQGGTFDVFVTEFDQQTFGAAQQAQAYYSYVVSNQDVDDPWSTWYTNAMASCKDLIAQSDAKGYNQYAGVGRILLAYSLQLVTDAWGDIPYSTAFLGQADITPSFDKDSTIYRNIYNLLDAAIDNLNNPNAGALVPNVNNEDRIYHGDLTKWIKFAHAIKARLDIHQSKNNPTMATNALTEVGLSFTSSDDDAIFPFGSSETTANPWYQFNEERTGYVDFAASTMAAMMAANADPRYTVYFDSTYNDIWGVGLGAYYGSPSSPVEFITYEELQFIKAEAILRSSGDIAAAQAADTTAIRVNMVKLGVATADINQYISAHGNLGATVADAIDSVGLQEYFALYLNPEAWTVYRRTGSPNLTAVTGTQGVPRRFVYPQTEYNYNAANTPNATLWAPRIFWDVP